MNWRNIKRKERRKISEGHFKLISRKLTENAMARKKRPTEKRHETIPNIENYTEKRHKTTPIYDYGF